MSDFSSLMGKFRIHKDTTPEPTAKVTKRPRESLACNQCKRAKLRCDRRQPCSSCTRKDAAVLCSYQRASPSGNHSATAEDRLAHLESLVKDLMENPYLGRPESNITSMETRSAEDSRVADSNLDEGRYVGSTHWSAILEDIHELKAARRQDAPEPDPETSLQSLGANKEVIIFGSPSDYPLEQVMGQHLPSRVEVDRLVAIYFQGENFIIPFIHTVQFQRLYRGFWADPANTNPLWLSMLFSICSASTLIRGTVGISPTSREDVIADANQFLAASGKCLVRGEYHRPQRFVLEALIMYAQCKNMQSLDPSREARAIFGMVVRMAHEMGYHRDPDFLGSFSPFECEMRRRFWALCKQVDLMVSFQLGLPSSICLENCDTKSPRNLADLDFDVDTGVLPPSRSEDEAIPLLWFIVKDRQMGSFYKVCRDALSFHEKSRTEILQLDSEIRRMYTTIPSVLRTRPLVDSIADPPFLIMTRIYVEFIYLKSLCVFHRKYMTRGNQFSTDSCSEAGQRLVRQFIEIYAEFSPGGRLHGHRWMLTNFTMNDFLLGVMVLCMVVHNHRRDQTLSSRASQNVEEDILPLLTQAHTICVDKSSASRDARYVSRAIAALLDGPVTRVTAPDLPVDHLAYNAVDGVSLGWLDPFYIEDNAGLDWGLLDSLVLNQPGEETGKD